MPSGRLAGAELNPLLASPFVRGRWAGPSPLAKREVGRAFCWFPSSSLGTRAGSSSFPGFIPTLESGNA
jgi:hypothetical protein